MATIEKEGGKKELSEFSRAVFSRFPAQMLLFPSRSASLAASCLTGPLHPPPPPPVCCAQARLCTWPGTLATPVRQSFPVRRWESTWRGNTASPKRPARARRWSWPPSENTHTHLTCTCTCTLVTKPGGESHILGPSKTILFPLQLLFQFYF